MFFGPTDSISLLKNILGKERTDLYWFLDKAPL